MLGCIWQQRVRGSMDGTLCPHLSLSRVLVLLTFPSTISLQITYSLLHSIVEQWLGCLHLNAPFYTF